MRVILAVLVAAGLSATTVQAEPLPAGKPAGVRAARLSAWDTAVMLGAGGAIMAGVGFLVSGTSSAIKTEHFDANAVPFQPTTSTATTS